jgi:hypothetical protein
MKKLALVSIRVNRLIEEKMYKHLKCIQFQAGSTTSAIKRKDNEEIGER